MFALHTWPVSPKSIQPPNPTAVLFIQWLNNLSDAALNASGEIQSTLLFWGPTKLNMQSSVLINTVSNLAQIFVSAGSSAILFNTALQFWMEGPPQSVVHLSWFLFLKLDPFSLTSAVFKSTDAGSTGSIPVLMLIAMVDFAITASRITRHEWNFIV